MTLARRLVRAFLGLLIVLVAAIVLLYWLRPQWLLDGYFAIERGLAGLRAHSVQVDGGEWRYADGGEGPPVLLVHGMGGSKENWMLLARRLRSDHRLIVPDQAGFGASDDAVDDDYRIGAQVERLRAFADAIGVERFHLVGHSMGGQIAGVFAARYPDRVQTLTLMSSAGVPFRRNAFQALLERGENPFATETVEKFDAFMRMTFEHPPFAPPRLRLAYAQRNARRAPLWDRIIRRISSPESRYYLQGKLGDIRAPTLVLWCDRDQLLDVSSVEAFKRGLPSAEVVVLKGCGHMPMMEQPDAVAARLRALFTT
jgi:abhydrolase domain-containing protein 6